LSSAYRLGEWTVRPNRNRIERGREVVHLAPKAMAVLQCLAGASNSVVSRQQIFDTVWRGAVVSDEALTQRISELRRAFGASPHKSRFIETIPKIGFRLIPEVQPLSEEPGSPSADEGRSAASFPKRPLALLAALVLVGSLSILLYSTRHADRTPAGDPGELRSIVVLPFEDLSETSDNAWLTDGITEELLNALAQLPGLRVTARTSSFFFKGGEYTVAEIADRLDVAYLVEGTLRRSDDRVRITAQLISTADASHLWSETYDRTLSDALRVQQEIAEHIAAELGVVLDDTTTQRMNEAGIHDVHAFVAYQKGMEAFARAHDGTAPVADQLSVANDYFDQALAKNPHLSTVRLMRSDRAGHLLRELVLGDRAERYPGETGDVWESLREELLLAWRLSPPGPQRDILNVESALIGKDWSSLSELVRIAMRPGKCPQLNGSEVLSAFGWADEMVAKWTEAQACNPLDPDTVNRLAGALIRAARPEEALAVLDQAEARGVYEDRFLLERCGAMIAAGRETEPEMQNCWSRSNWRLMQVYHQMRRGDRLQARQAIQQYMADPKINLELSLHFSNLLGDRERANEYAARIDAKPGSALILAQIVSKCLCGAPFDLDATPNFKARVQEAGFAWPPKRIFEYPVEDS